MLEVAIYSRLAGFAGLAALVGDRIYPVAAPDAAAAPYVVFTPQAALDQTPDLDGLGTLFQTRVQFDTWGLDFDSVAAAAGQARLALEDLTDGLIADVAVDGGFDAFEDIGADNPTRWFRRTFDLLFVTTSS